MLSSLLSSIKELFYKCLYSYKKMYAFLDKNKILLVNEVPFVTSHSLIAEYNQS